MDLTYTPEEEAFRSELRAYLTSTVKPDWKMPGFWSSVSADESFALRREWEADKARAGFAGIQWPVEFGGRGGTPGMKAIYDEEMSRARAPQSANQLGLTFLAPTIMVLGTDEQKKEIIGPLLRNEVIWVQGFSEPGAGSDLAALRCAGVQEGEEFVVNGQKVWTTQAMHGDKMFALVRTGAGTSKHEGISMLLIDMDQPGVEARPLKQISGESEFGEVFFSDAPVGRDALLGELGQGWQVAIATLAHERAGTLSQLALLRQVLDEVVDHGRAAHYRGASLDLLTRRRIAGIYEQVSVMGALGERVLGAARDGLPGPEGSIIKLIWSQTNRDLGELRMALLHDEGTAWCAEQDSAADAEARFMFLRSRSSTIAAGTSEVQRNIIAERVLGLPQEPRSSHHDSRRT